MVTAKKIKTAFFCSQCGAQHPKWQGQCHECGEWNTLVEEKIPDKRTAAAPGGPVRAKKISEIGAEASGGVKCGIEEFDRVLGGRLLPGMTVLLGGEPGIGKSTLILQAAEAYSKQGLAVLYVTGEESLPQIKLRADRLGVRGDRVTVVNSTSLEEITAAVGTGEYRVVLVDSIQTVASAMFLMQRVKSLRIIEAASQLINQAKAAGHALFLGGHVTKDGMVAGPKVLEHMVDTVIYFEGDAAHLYRMLRATKNRFGSIAEVGIFEMAASGLVEVANPSSMFLAGRDDQRRSGSVVTGICEGNRPILVEVQALVTTANYGNPQRVAGGIDNKRLALLLAILEKRGGYPMATNDVFVSVAGGLKLTEPAVDLPVLAAIASSLMNRAVDPQTLLVGEVGLSGEVRGVTNIDRRVSEAARMGFKRMILPKANLDKIAGRPLDLIGVAGLQDALEIVLG